LKRVFNKNIILNNLPIYLHTTGVFSDTMLFELNVCWLGNACNNTI